MSGDESLKPASASVEQAARDTDVAHEPIPAICFLDDLARILRTSRRTIDKLRRYGALPIAELPSIDKRARFSGEAVKRFIDGESTLRGLKRRA